MSLRTLFSLIHTIIFACALQNFAVASHNLHGYKTSSQYHKQCLQDIGGVWMAQELWLTERQLSQLSELNANFTAHSGMEEIISNGIFRGRPFGGVSVSWSPIPWPDWPLQLITAY